MGQLPSPGFAHAVTASSYSYDACGACHHFQLRRSVDPRSSELCKPRRPPRFGKLWTKPRIRTDNHNLRQSNVFDLSTEFSSAHHHFVPGSCKKLRRARRLLMFRPIKPPGRRRKTPSSEDFSCKCFDAADDGFRKVAAHVANSASQPPNQQSKHRI